MIDSQSRLVENLLARPEIHRQWSRHYRTADNESFYEQAFDDVLRVLNPPFAWRDVASMSTPWTFPRARWLWPRTMSAPSNSGNE